VKCGFAWRGGGGGQAADGVPRLPDQAEARRFRRRRGGALVTRSQYYFLLFFFSSPLLVSFLKQFSSTALS